MNSNNNKTTDSLIIIFTRNPELGKVKTRLAKGIGNENALEVYKHLLEHTKVVTEKIKVDKCVWYSVKVRHNDIWNEENYQKKAQFGDDLGERMLHAFEDAFKNGYKKALIIGSDLYDLRPKYIEQAFKELDENDVVFGPAKDGGYYLLGMKTIHESLFNNKKWGSETVLKDSLKNVKSKKVSLLETLNDIDYAEDLEGYEFFQPYLKK